KDEKTPSLVIQSSALSPRPPRRGPAFLLPLHSPSLNNRFREHGSLTRDPGVATQTGMTAGVCMRRITPPHDGGSSSAYSNYTGGKIPSGSGISVVLLFASRAPLSDCWRG